MKLLDVKKILETSVWSKRLLLDETQRPPQPIEGYVIITKCAIGLKKAKRQLCRMGKSVHAVPSQPFTQLRENLL